MQLDVGYFSIHIDDEWYVSIRVEKDHAVVQLIEATDHNGHLTRSNETASPTRRDVARYVKRLIRTYKRIMRHRLKFQRSIEELEVFAFHAKKVIHDDR